MKQFLILLFAGVFQQAIAQQFYFPASILHDSAALQHFMPRLANELLNIYSNDKDKDFDNLFRFQIVAAAYNEAVASIDSVQKQYSDTMQSKGIDFQFRTYCLAKQQMAHSPGVFDSVYKNILKTCAEKLPEKARSYLDLYFSTNLQQIKEKYNGVLLKQATNKDSISYDNLKILVRSYCSFLVYNQILPPGKPIIDEIEWNDYLVEDNLKIPMRDGAVISATIVRKKSITAPQPAVLMFNIYASSYDKYDSKKSAANGFVGIVANTRGKALSPQEIEPFEHDARDAYDIIDWISKQPWCNGKVGMYGGSYLGFSQWAAAKYHHPALKTIVPQVAVGAGIDYPMWYNCFTAYMLRWIHLVTNNKFTDDGDFSNSAYWRSVYLKWYASGKSFRALDTIEGRSNKIFQRWLNHPGYDAFWQNMTPDSSQFANLNIPVLTTTGYFDDEQLGALYYLRRHYQCNPKANHYLVIGPYDHYGAQSTSSDSLSGYVIDKVGKINFDDLVFEWFNYTLNDGPKPALLKDRFNFQVMGTNTWYHAPALKAPSYKTYYLSNVSTGGSFVLTDIKPAVDEYIRYQIDLADRSDTTALLRQRQFRIVDTALNTNSCMVFVSEPLKEDITIHGSFEAQLKFICNKKDADLLLSLYEQLPGGRYFSLSSTAFRASYAKDYSRRQLLTPGKLYTLPFPPSVFVSKLITKGSRLLLIARVKKEAGAQINYGSGKDVSDETIHDAGAPMQLQLFSGSSIRIPVMK